MSPEDFNRFLSCLSPDAAEAGRLYTRLHEKLACFFYLRGIADTGGAADEAIDRAAVKISAGTPVPDVGRYCLGVARNVAKERRRLEQRESTTFLRFIESRATDSCEEIERIQRLLKPCFDQLAAEERELLSAYCGAPRGRARADHRRELAATMRTTVTALRMRVTRLRSALTDCVRRRSGVGSAKL